MIKLVVILNMRVYLLFVLLICMSQISLAQRKDIDTSKILQLSGVVVSEHDLNPMPYITVYDRSIGRGLSQIIMAISLWFHFPVIPYIFLIMVTKPQLTSYLIL